MPKNRKIRLLAFGLASVLGACIGSDGAADERPTAPETMLRLDLAIAADSALDPVMAAGWNEMASVMSTDISHSDYSRLPAVKVFSADVERLLPPLDSVETVLGHVKARMSELLPDVGWKRTFAIVWPYSQSISYGTDGAALVALNHYLGADYPGYAGRFPAYIAANKTIGMLPVNLTEAILGSEYAYVSPDNGNPSTLLNRMLHDGAIAYAMKSCLPEATPLSTLLGISPEQAEWLVRNEAEVWRLMMERRLVYSTDPQLADRLLGRSPASHAISPDAPGMTARFIGMRIIEAYAGTHPDTTLDQMLSPDFYNSNQSLIDSNYAPGKQ